MKRSVFLISCAAILLLAVFCIPFIARPNMEESSSSSPSNILSNSTANSVSSQEAPPISSSTPPKEVSTSSGYFVQSYEGHIGIFRNGEDKPMEETQVELNALPEADQILLQEGIYAESEAELRQIIEDYES